MCFFFFFRIVLTIPLPSELDSDFFYHIPSNSDRRLSPINVELLFSSLTSNVPETTNVSEASV